MGNRRYARPQDLPSPDSISERLATALVPQYSQTGVGNSTAAILVNTLTVTGAATIQNLAVGSSFTVQSSALRSMAFQSATGAAAIFANSSWLSGPVTSTAAAIQTLTVSSAIAFGTFVSDVGVLLTGYIKIQTSTGGAVNLAVVSS